MPADDPEAVLPGSFPATPSATEVTVNPLPATGTASNPVHLAPGEPVPSDVSPHTVQSTVTTDKAAYEGDHSHPALRGGGYQSGEGGAQPHIQSSAPESSTAALAAGVPLEPNHRSEKAAADPPHSTTPADVSVNPLPASGTSGNPIHLAPGEPVPSDVSPHTVQSTVTTDQAAYEGDHSHPALRGDGTQSHIQSSAPESSTAALAAGVSLEPNRRSAADPTHSANPATIQSAVPDSTTASLAGNVSIESARRGPSAAAIQSAAPESTTSALTGSVPLEPRASAVHPASAEAPSSPYDHCRSIASDVPNVVRRSMSSVHAPLEAAHSELAVEDKAAVESELLSYVPPEPEAPARDVPEPVVRSLSSAHEQPEGAANESAVEEKAVIESELTKRLPETKRPGALPAEFKLPPTEPGAEESIPTLEEANSPPTSHAPISGAEEIPTFEESGLRHTAPLSIPTSKHDNNTVNNADPKSVVSGISADTAMSGRSKPADVKPVPSAVDPVVRGTGGSGSEEVPRDEHAPRDGPVPNVPASALDSPDRSGTEPSSGEAQPPTSGNTVPPVVPEEADGPPRRELKKKHRVSAFFSGMKQIFRS